MGLVRLAMRNPYAVIVGALGLAIFGLATLSSCCVIANKRGRP